MAQFSLPAFAEQLNDKASSHPVGSLQQIRAELHGKRRSGHKVFSSQTITEDWAFHHGGRPELQFNIGLDGSNGKELRWGVAFSLETSRSLPTIDVLRRKVELFNEFLRRHPHLYRDMWMWHWRGSVRSKDSRPAPIPHELVSNGVFVFLGHRKPVGDLDHELVLDDMDRLLPLYRYVESEGRIQPLSNRSKGFVFLPGFKPRGSTTTARFAPRQLDVNLRHNVLQEALYRRLVARHGEENVKAELPTVLGTSVDLVVRRPGGVLVLRD